MVPTSPSSSPVPAPADIVALARDARTVAVLTGAGMSAESGVPTFRDAQTGLWARFDPMELATPEAWERDRAFVWAWYVWRMGLVSGARPNAGHRALARWADAWHPRGRHVRIATQNVDDLHERAGSEVLAHVHGSLFAHRCERCDTPYEDPVVTPGSPVERIEPPSCARCGAAVRPGVVWFGEMLPEGEFAAALDAATQADLVLVVGTSGIVHPFAGLPLAARDAGVPVVEVNPVDTELTHLVDYRWRAGAAVALPALVDAVLSAGVVGR
ncbi:MAG: NAD-dependent deacylase [Dermatophilaceae bacterium]